MTRPTVTTAPRPEWRVVKALDAAKLTVTSVLTYPEYDLEGDWVEPAGCRWDDARLTVDVDHDPRQVVGRGSVVMKADPELAGGVPLPHGTTHFDRTSALGVQAFRLVEAGISSGVSIEFEPRVKKAIGPSLARGRGGVAYRYEDYHLVGWCHCVHLPPVNQHARTLPETVGKALSILDAGRLGGDPLHPTIKKALSLYRDYPRPTTVSVPRSLKAMDDQYQDPAAPPPTDAPPPDMPADDGTTPTAKAGYNLSQGLADLIAMVQDDLKKGEHVKGKAKLTKLLTKLEACVGDAAAIADDVAGEVGGGAGEPPPEGDEGGEGDEPPADDEPADESGDDDDTVPKAFVLKKAADGTIVTRTGYRPARLGVLKAGAVVPAYTPPPAPPAPAADDPMAKILAARAASIRARNGR